MDTIFLLIHEHPIIALYFIPLITCGCAQVILNALNDKHTSEEDLLCIIVPVINLLSFLLVLMALFLSPIYLLFLLLRYLFVSKPQPRPKQRYFHEGDIVRLKKNHKKQYKVVRYCSFIDGNVVCTPLKGLKVLFMCHSDLERLDGTNDYDKYEPLEPEKINIIKNILPTYFTQQG